MTPRTGHLKQDMTLNAGHGKIEYPFTFPKGTRCRELQQGTLSAVGKFFIDALSVIPEGHIARHDAEHYGIIVDEKDVEMDPVEKAAAESELDDRGL
jgi:hypothetical protein